MTLNIPNFKGEISTNPSLIQAHSTDRSIFSITPKAVICPKSAEDIIAVINFAKENNSTISVRAGGTCMSGGSLDNGYILNLTKYLNKVEVDPIKMIATVEAGAYFRDIEDLITPHGLMFAPYPSSHRICGIGGMIGNNASGEQSIRHGATIDNIQSLEVVLGTGEKITTGPKEISSLTKIETELFSLFLRNVNDLKIFQGKVSKVASGYRLDRVVRDRKVDLTGLFVGAQGTLGIVTKAVLKLTPIPKHHELVVVCAKSLEMIPELLNIARKYNPECIETFDINTFNASEINLKEEVSATRKYVTADCKLCVLIQFSEDTTEQTLDAAKKFIDDTKHLNVSPVHIQDEVLRDMFWKLRRTSFTSIQNYNKGSFKAVPCIEDIIVPVENISKLIFGLEKILDRDKITYGYHGHIGDGSLRIIPFFDLSDPDASKKIINLMKEVFILVKKCKGNMCADHSDGIIRSPFVEEFYGKKIFKAFKEIKEIFDPKNILNPKKKVGAVEGDINKGIMKE